MANEKILVVDDDKNICELLRLYLVKEGYNVTMVHDGAAALTEFASGEENALVDLMDLCDARGVSYAYMGIGDTSGIYYRPVW